MKMTVELPEDLVRELKMRAVREGRKLKDAAAEVLRAGLAAGQPQRGTSHGRGGRARVIIRKDPKTGLPVIQCPHDAPARRMTAAHLRELEYQAQEREDLERHGISVRQ